MQLITEDDFDVIEHPNPTKIARHFAAAQAATEYGAKARAFVAVLNATAAPVEVQKHGDCVVAVWWVGDLADGLDLARRATPPAAPCNSA